MKAVIPVAGNIKGKSAISAPVPLLPEHSQPQDLAGLPQDCQGIAVWHISDVYAIYLEDRDINQEGKRTIWLELALQTADLFTQMSSCSNDMQHLLHSKETKFSLYNILLPKDSTHCTVFLLSCWLSPDIMPIFPFYSCSSSGFDILLPI